MNKKLLGYYNYTVVLTYIGMIAGFAGIAFIMDCRFFSAIVCLMSAGVCDMFDGTVAATKERQKKEKNFGIQIDSLCDLICFGVLPASFVYRMNMSVLSFFIAALYVLCALIRLAYFNVDEQERQNVSSKGREYYLGLPVTMSALVFPMILELNYIFIFGKYAGMGALAGMGILFLVPFKIKKPGLLGKLCIFIFGMAELSLLLMTVFMVR